MISYTLFPQIEVDHREQRRIENERAVGVISALALGLGGLAACGNSSSAESKNGRVYYLNKKAEEQSTWVKLGKAFEKETGCLLYTSPSPRD